MDTKTKILVILPYWLIFILSVICLQFTGVLLANHPSVAAVSAPQVLGVSTTTEPQIRGSDVPQTKPISQINQPDLSAVNAQGYLVFDLASGQDLLSKNADQKFAIASLTKLMTGLVAYNRADLNQTFKITVKDVLSVKPNLGLAVGDEVKALDIFNSMLIGSCNDAAKALADYTQMATGSDFIGLMNDEAQTLGMQNSSFQNPMGFDNGGNYSTAEDLKLLITATQKLAPFTDLGRRTSYQFADVRGKSFYVPATNKLIKKYPDIQAIKTGFTNEASGAMATKIDLASHEVIILVLDSQNREGDTLKLKAAVASSFDWQ